jgi:signal peptidase
MKKMFMNKLPRVALATLLIVVSVMAIAVAALSIPVGIQHTWSATNINNSDMSPTIPRGSLVISEKVPTSKIKEGDIVALNSVTGSRVASVSRVITKSPSEDKKSTYYQVQGDNNDLPDDWSYQAGSSTYKLLYSVPVVGFIVAPLNNPVGAALFVILIVAASIFFARFFFDEPEDKEEVIIDDREFQDGIEDLRQIFNEAGVQEELTFKKTRAEKRAIREQKKEARTKSNEKVDASINE